MRQPFPFADRAAGTAGAGLKPSPGFRNRILRGNSPYRRESLSKKYLSASADIYNRYARVAFPELAETEAVHVFLPAQIVMDRLA